MRFWIAVLAMIGAVVVFFWAARRSWRRRVRAELVTALREVEPGVEVVAEGQVSLDLRLPDGSTGTAFLHNFYAVLSQASSDEAEEREAIRAFARSLVCQQQDLAGPLDLERHGERLLPRLAPQDLVRESAGDNAVLCRDAGIPGLVVAYVLDSEHSVMYLTQSHLGELGVDLEALHARATANLRRTFPAAVVRAVVEKGQVTMLRAGDTFDATRLLLVPSVLEEGESLAAAIPDRETLALMPVPADGDWSPLARVAREAASPYRLVDKPVRVTREGFELMG